MRSWVLFAGIWVFGYLLTIFLFMLICRLEGEDPEDVYELDGDDAAIYLFLILLWPLGFAGETLYFLYKFLKKWFVLIIELIIARKEMNEDEDDVYNDQHS